MSLAIRTDKSEGEPMHTVRSKDGTMIAYSEAGKGPALILVSGALGKRSDAEALVELLSKNFTVFTYDRRGRGDSGDSTAVYSTQLEVDDLEVVITAAQGNAFVYGHSSGAVLALEAARMLPTRITRLALYEPPFIIDGSRPGVPEDYTQHLNSLIAAGMRSEAVEYFMARAVGIPADVIAGMRESPMWPGMEKLAHTIAYDGTIMGDTMNGNPASLQRWVSVEAATLVLDGGDSPEFMHHGAEALARILPHAQHRRLAGQNHGPAESVLVPVLVEFFTS
jgi:pimeloyl-ACP methyl ester carboxylesterase